MGGGGGCRAHTHSCYEVVLGALSGPPLIRPNHVRKNLPLNPVRPVVRICQLGNTSSQCKNPLSKLLSQNFP